jgi:hypothetical protein
MERNSFKYWYKKSFESIDEIPPKNVWNNINDELNKIDAGRRKKRLAIYIPSALLLITISLLFVNQYNSVYSPVSLANTTQINFEEDDAFDLKQTQILAIEKIAEQTNTEKLLLANALSKNYTPQPPENIDKKEQQDLYLNKKDAQLIAFNHNHFLPFSLPNVSNTNEKSTSKTPAFWAGVGYSFTNSTLLNHALFRGLDANSLVMMHNYTQHNFSFIGGYQINNRYALTARIGIANSSGQKLSTYIEGNYTTSELTLNYHKLSVGIDKKLSTYLNPIREIAPLYLNSSIFISKITSVEMSQSNHTKNILSSNYSAFDAGVSFALSAQISVTNKLKIIPQIETSIGLINVFKGDGYIPKHFNKTQSLSISPGLLLSYSF